MVVSREPLGLDSGLVTARSGQGACVPEVLPLSSGGPVLPARWAVAPRGQQGEDQRSAASFPAARPGAFAASASQQGLRAGVAAAV